jgi:hypothetical protein
MRRGDDGPHGMTLESPADLEELADLGGRQAVDPQHPAVAGRDQTLLLEVPEGLPHRAATDPE